jgi:hypothetical protein
MVVAKIIDEYLMLVISLEYNIFFKGFKIAQYTPDIWYLS